MKTDEKIPRIKRTRQTAFGTQTFMSRHHGVTQSRVRGNPNFNNLGVNARIMLVRLIGEHVVTEHELCKSMSLPRTGVYSQYRKLVASGFNIRRMAISMTRRQHGSFKRGFFPTEVVYYI